MAFWSRKGGHGHGAVKHQKPPPGDSACSTYTGEVMHTRAGGEHRSFLAGVTLQQILDDRDAERGNERKTALVDAAAQSTLLEAVKLMHKEKIKHLPVYSMTPPMCGNEAEKFYVGVVSVSDILSGIHEKSLRGDGVDEDCSRDDPVTLIDLLKTVSKQWIYPSFHHLDVVLQPILGGAPAIIVQRYKDLKKDTLAVVTQTDIGRFLLKNIDKMDDGLKSKQLGHTVLGTKEHFDESFTVDCSKTAAAAFHRMHFYHHESLAVVDDSSLGFKKIIANLSASDLRGLSEDDLKSLEQKSVLEFLKEKRSDSSNGHRAPVTVTPATTIEEVLRTLVREHINQVWVVTDPDSGKLVSQVLLTEIMELFMIHPYTV